MSLQAHYEGKHVRNADFVITTSQYAANRLRALYGVSKIHSIIPELIDLSGWRSAIRECTRPRDPSRFVILCVCRFYPRKRVQVLLAAADMLRDRIPNLEIRIVGGGPESGRLRATCRMLGLRNVTFRENISQTELVTEYCGCDVFCLPSVQEGFGIVFLEAMACAKPIVASRATAVPEVVQHGILTEPDSPVEIAQAIYQFYLNAAMREDLGQAGAEFVERFDAPIVARSFVGELREMMKKT